MPGNFSYTESTNTAVVIGGTSGDPATFADFVASDRRGDERVSSVASTAPTCDSDWVSTKGTGWAYDSTNKEYDGTATTGDLTRTSLLVSGRMYEVTYTVKNYSAGTVCIVLGTQLGTGRTANGTYTEWIRANGTSFIIRGTVAFTGSVDDIYVRQMGSFLMASATINASPKTFTLTYPVRPVEQKGLRLLLYVTGTVDAGDTIDVYGVGQTWTTFSATEAAGQTVLSVTDASIFQPGDAIRLIDITSLSNSETATIAAGGINYKNNTITVTAGITAAGGSYVSGDIIGIAETEQLAPPAAGINWTTKRYGYISTIVCTAMNNNADEFLEVHQPIWGVIWDLRTTIWYPNCEDVYRIDAKFTIGDGSTSTYFKDLGSFLIINKVDMNVTAAATLQLGKLDATDNFPRQGSHIRFCNLDSGMSRTITWAGVILAYGTNFVCSRDYSDNTSLKLQFSNSSCVVNTCTFVGFDGVKLSGTCTRITANNVYFGYNFYANATLNDLVMDGPGSTPSYHCSMQLNATATARGLVFKNNGTARGIQFESNSITFSAIDATNIPTKFYWNYYTSTVFDEQYSCNINVCDSSGTAISGAVVDCVDVSANAAWTAGTVTTDASGNITEQIITYKRNVPGTGVPGDLTSTTTTTYSPHKFTISKAGYETLTLENITVDAPIDWHLELQDEPTDAEIAQAVWQYGNRTLTA